MNFNMSVSENIIQLKREIPDTVTLVAVSKTKAVPEIMEAYNTGHRIFGENKIQEMEAKWKEMPKDVEWHMIGHVQRNKVKYMAPFVSLIHAVDSLKLLKEINKQARKNNRVINCLIQIKIAEEESKFGLSEAAAREILASEAFQSMEHVNVLGVMGMATFTENEAQLVKEFQKLKAFFDTYKNKYGFTEISMGMSGDYAVAIAQGSTMIRVGSAIFGKRNYS
ncbi:YggS family pyridoxal phosphate enzyme [Constantimarinum furrinae]|uniref:Pyridoxal phosphate homeostasis protein n=2 Tax=Constantimarinum furrinae TaxID=2562285 RepID=A0A7G8PY03_9FLAO|nr:YggS family pyridoxal phosphate enzyme [Constantimarinum furrinae]